MLADEQFIASERTGAAEHYRRAEEYVALLRPETGTIDANEINLIRAELDYRQSLLEHGASFWGLGHLQRPIHPIAAWRQFGQTFDRLDEQIRAIELLTVQLLANRNDSANQGVEQLQAEEDRTVGELQQEVARTQLRYLQLRRNMLEDRLSAIRARQTQIATERGALLDQMAQASASINAALVNAIGGQLGLPPEAASLLQGVAAGNVSGAVRQAAQAYVQNQAGALAGPLAEISSTAAEAARLYHDARGAIARGQQLYEQGASVLRAVQSRDTGKLLELGVALSREIPPEAMRELESRIMSNPTLREIGEQAKAAVSLARQGSELRAAASAFVAGHPDLAAAARAALERELNVAAPQFAERYAATLQGFLASADSAAKRFEALQRLLRAWPETFVDDMIGGTRTVAQARLRSIAQSLGLNCSDLDSCRQRLLDRLKSSVPVPAELFEIANDGSVRIRGTNPGAEEIVFELARFSDIVRGRALEQSAQELAADVAGLLQQAAVTPERLAAIVQRLPDTLFDAEVAPLLRNLQGQAQSAFVDAVRGRNGASAGDALAQEAARFALGRDVASATVLPALAGGAAPNAGGGAAPPPANAQEEMMLAAMSSLGGPYGAMAATAVRVLQSLEALSEAAARARELDREDQNLTAEFVHLVNFKIDIERDEALAHLAEQIAIARQRGSANRGRLLQTALQDRGSQASVYEAAIRRRLPLTFYLSELIRERFDRFDQALAFWQGDVDEGRRVERLVRGDPGTARLALDPDIRLYQWFDRSAQGQRADLDELREHWRSLRTIATTVCDRADVGCAPTIAQLGIVDVSAPIRLSTLVPETLRRASADNKVQFVLRPEHLAGIADINGLRVVAVAAATLPEAGIATNVEIRHSGLGYIVVDGQSVRESLEASSPGPPEFAESAERVNALRSRLQRRWQNDNDQLAPIEGYPLFGLYEVTLPSGFLDRRTDLVLHFFYQRPLASRGAPVVRPTVQLVCTAGGRQQRLETERIRLLLPYDDGSRTDRFDNSQLEECTLMEAAQQ